MDDGSFVKACVALAIALVLLLALARIADSATVELGELQPVTALYLPLVVVNSPAASYAVAIEPHNATATLSHTFVLTVTTSAPEAMFIEQRIHVETAALRIVTATMQPSQWCGHYAGSSYSGVRCWSGLERFSFYQRATVVTLEAVAVTGQPAAVEVIALFRRANGEIVIRNDIAWVVVE